MLEMTKTVLQSVSFDKNLFKKELEKSKRWLSREEIKNLKVWCMATFGAVYSDVIVDVLNNVV